MKKTQQGVFSKRLKVWRKQRSGGSRLVGPVYTEFENHNHGGVRYWNLTVGNPERHTKWAFNAYFYWTGV